MDTSAQIKLTTYWKGRIQSRISIQWNSAFIVLRDDFSRNRTECPIKPVRGYSACCLRVVFLRMPSKPSKEASVHRVYGVIVAELWMETPSNAAKVIPVSAVLKTLLMSHTKPTTGLSPLTFHRFSITVFKEQLSHEGGLLMQLLFAFHSASVDSALTSMALINGDTKMAWLRMEVALWQTNLNKRGCMPTLCLNFELDSCEKRVALIFQSPRILIKKPRWQLNISFGSEKSAIRVNISL